MPLYLDTHKKIPGLTAEAVAGAPQPILPSRGSTA
jgi:hypothetical protein